MRDGIYKNPALSMPWRALLESCTLDAERGEIAREKSERAAGLQLREIRPQFMAALREKAEEAGSLLPGIKAFDAEVTTSDLGRQNSPLENRMLSARRTSRECRPSVCRAGKGIVSRCASRNYERPRETNRTDHAYLRIGFGYEGDSACRSGRFQLRKDYAYR